MQEMTSEVCDILEPGTEYEFRDTRDDKTYKVEKFADGNCWMMENLDLDLDPERTLTPADTDIKTDYTPGRKTQTSSDEVGEWEYDQSCLNGDLRACYEASKNQGNIYSYSYDTGKKEDGNLYNLFSASAEKGEVSENGEISPEGSICPKGWHMAQTNDYINLLNVQGYGVLDNNSSAGNYEEAPVPFNSVHGFYAGSRAAIYIGQGAISYGYTDSLPWGDQGEMYGFQGVSSTILMVNIDNGSYYFFGTLLGMSNGMYGFQLDGAPIRCFADPSFFKIKYNENTTDSVSNFPDSEKLEREGRTEITLSSKIPERDGYFFAGWATSASGEVKYSPGQTLVAQSLNLYAVWYKSVPNINTMQFLTPEVCSNLDPEEQYALEDARDEKLYTISKLADGNCWMTSDLETELIVEGNEAGIRKINSDQSEEIVPITSDNTDLNTKSSWAPTSSTETNQYANWWCYGTDCDSTSHSLKYNDYYFYTYHTATLNSVPTTEQDSNNVIAPDSICPKGWQLPSDVTFGNLINLYVADNPTLENPPTNLKKRGYEHYKDNYIHYETHYWTSLSLSINGATIAKRHHNVDDKLLLDSYNDTAKVYGNGIRCVLREPAPSQGSSLLGQSSPSNTLNITPLYSYTGYQTIDQTPSDDPEESNDTISTPSDSSSEPSDEYSEPLGVLKSVRKSDSPDYFPLVVLSLATITLNTVLIVTVLKRKRDEEIIK